MRRTPGLQRLGGAEHGGVFLHGALHAVAQLGGRRAAVGVAQAVEAGEDLCLGRAD